MHKVPLQERRKIDLFGLLLVIIALGTVIALSAICTYYCTAQGWFPFWISTGWLW